MKPSKTNRTIYEIVTLDDPHHPINASALDHHSLTANSEDERMDTPAVTA